MYVNLPDRVVRRVAGVVADADAGSPAASALLYRLDAVLALYATDPAAVVSRLDAIERRIRGGVMALSGEN